MMDDARFDPWMSALAGGGNRRHILRALTAGATGLAVSWLGLGDVGARKNRKKKKRKKKKRGPSSSPPTGPGRCDLGNGVGYGGPQRWAQTFRLAQDGNLTTAQITLIENPADFTLTFQIRTANRGGAPTNTVLGAALVTLNSATVGGDPPRTVQAVFPTPPPITRGQLHALVVTGPSGTPYIIQTNAGNSPCLDGNLFTGDVAAETFTRFGGATTDMVYALTITP